MTGYEGKASDGVAVRQRQHTSCQQLKGLYACPQIVQ